MLRPKNRWTAFAIHLTGSVIAFFLLAFTIRQLWYPGVLFFTEGGLEGLKLIAGVDIIIGPLLTLIVYNTTKRELRRDLVTIGIFQILCFFGGIYIVAQYRPIAIIYADNIFYTITAAQFEAYDIDIDNIEYLDTGWPALLALDLPTDKTKRAEEVRKIKMNGDLRLATGFYQNYEDHRNRLATEGWSLNEAKERGIDISKIKENQNDIRVFLLVSRYGIFNVAVDTKSGDLLQVIE